MASLITGGASGIRRQPAVAFAKHGAGVMVSDQMTAGGEETVQIIRKAGGKSIFVQSGRHSTCTRQSFASGSRTRLWHAALDGLFSDERRCN